MSGYDSSAAVSPKRCGTLSRIARKAAPDPRQSQIERAFPADLIAAARTISGEVLGDLGGKSAVARKVHDSYVAFRERTGAWSRISLKAVLEAREG